jgi:hypothetical protein
MFAARAPEKTFFAVRRITRFAAGFWALFLRGTRTGTGTAGNACRRAAPSPLRMTARRR